LAINDLVQKIDPQRFHETFGAPGDQLETLVASNTVTISRLLEIAPPGTTDPSSMVYNTTMYVMAGLLAVALVANLLMRPVDSKHHLDEACNQLDLT